MVSPCATYSEGRRVGIEFGDIVVAGSCIMLFTGNNEKKNAKRLKVSHNVVAVLTTNASITLARVKWAEAASTIL